MTDDIAAFIRARLDEDEHFANQEDADYANTTLLPTFDSEHQHRWDTDRVRRGVEAKRRLLRKHEGRHECPIEHPDLHITVLDGDTCATKRLLASEHSTHPDYRLEWRSLL